MSLRNDDMALIKGHRGRHIRYGFALQLVTIRYLGCFLADPLEVPNKVLDVVAGQLGIGERCGRAWERDHAGREPRRGSIGLSPAGRADDQRQRH
ncbi:DUF4158 domain-containing protein [Nonomuraea sp. GTA35]|uniref:DUF4158 domain-containing protein n=1 Tax=Nonomuraea sp. GTA35 TaxID=1676746 RepID=UPI0035BFBC51